MNSQVRMSSSQEELFWLDCHELLPFVLGYLWLLLLFWSSQLMILTATCCCLSSYAPPLASDRGPRIVGAVNSVPNPFTITSSRPPPRAEHPRPLDYRSISSATWSTTTTLQVSVQNLEASCCSTSTGFSSGKNLTLGVAIKSVSFKLGLRWGHHLLLLHSFAANWPIVTALIG